MSQVLNSIVPFLDAVDLNQRSLDMAAFVWLSSVGQLNNGEDVVAS